MKLNDTTSSFALVRTNPKLTGNVKITIDSTNNVWLNSIDANKELSNDKFKKFPIEENSSYPVDLYKFFDDGNTPEEIVFDLKQKFPTPDSISKKYEDQYDLFYAMGAQLNISNQYAEEYSYFAPLWIKDTLPEYFIICRIKDPLDFPYNENIPSGQIESGKVYKVVGEGLEIIYDGNPYESDETFTGTNTTTYTISVGSGSVVLLDENKNYPFSIPEHFETILDKMEVIKTFDLTENSKIGKYIKKLKSADGFPDAPLTVRFEEELLTTYNGIGYREGVLTQKGEFLDNYWKRGNSTIDFEEFVTQGFERQGIICANLLNLEFLFDDKETDLYTIPRYLGFYVSKNDIGKFQLSGRDLYAWKNVAGNNEKPKRDEHGYAYQEYDYIQTNENGVRLFIENTVDTIPDYVSIQKDLRSFYIQDKNNNFHSLDRNSNFGVGNNGDVWTLQGTEVFGSSAPSFSQGDIITWIGGSATVVSYTVGTAGNTVLVVNNVLGNQTLIPFFIWSNGTTFFLPLSNVYTINPSYKDLVVKDTTLNLKDFSGRGTIKLQARGELTDNKGRGYAVIKILGNLYPNDKIKIYWSVGQLVDSPNVNGKYDLFVANDLSIPLGPENWGAKSAYEDDYFHPYGTPNEIAQGIAKAINGLEAKNFTAYAIADEVVIRANGPGTFSNSYRIEVDVTDTSRLQVQGQDPTNGTLYNWEGGTDYSNTRIVKVSLADSVRLSVDDYIETDRGLSKIDHIGRFVDIEKNGTLEGFTSYAAIAIEDHLEEPLIGNSRSFKAVTLYQVPVGLFTFFDVKEIDGDFFSSTYGRSPIDEVRRYFDLRAGEPVLEVNKTYIVIGDGEIDFDGTTYPRSPLFSEPPYNNVAFRRDSGDPDFFTIVSGNPIVIGLEFFENTFSVSFTGDPYLQITDPNGSEYLDLDNLDKDLGSFTGFETLRSLTQVGDELLIPGDSDLDWRFRDKFTYKEIESEYDYLNENFTVNRSTKSRLVPFINKWVYQGGKDVRDNPYRLNTSLSFGHLNFSPSFDVRKQDPSSFTHEWYYLEKFPEFYSEELKKDTYSYFNEKIDRAQLINGGYNSQTFVNDPNIDYFLNYFTVDEGNGMSSLQERFVILNFNKETGFVEGLFRGVKLRVLEVVPGGTANVRTTSRKPPFIEGSSRFDDYKFSAILKIKKPDVTKIESPINIEVIENKFHKTITFLVELVVNDYRIDIHDPGLLSLAISAISAEYKTEDKLFDESILDYTALYSLKDQRKLVVPYPSSGDTIINAIDDTKLHVGLNLSFPSGTSTKFGDHWGVVPFDNPDYDWDLREEIHSFEPSNIFTTTNLFGHDIIMPYPELTEEDKVYLNKILGSPPLTLNKFQNVTTSSLFIIPSSSPGTWKNNPVFQIEGGKLFLEPIMEKISLSEIANKVNNVSPLVKYTTTDFVSNQVIETTGEFYLEFLPPTKIEKEEDLKFIVDQDKPEELKTTSIIGYALESLPVTTEIYRYSGPYEPKFRDLLFFKNQKTDSFLQNNLFFEQTKFNPSAPDFGIIQNFNYLKVSEADILTLTKNDKYDPSYPYIGETPIDKKDFYIFHSNWDPGYYQEHVTRIQSEPRAGTREMREYKNFFGSKIMKTSTSVKIEKINVTQVASLDNLNLDLSPNEITYEENDKLIRGIISIDKRFVRFLIEDGADKFFKDNLIPEFGTGDTKSINDDVEEYIRENVLPSYFVQNLVFYVKKSQEDLPAVVGDLSDKDKLAAGYAISKDVGVSKLDDFLYTFEIKKDESFDTSVAISMIISKI